MSHKCSDTMNGLKSKLTTGKCGRCNLEKICYDSPWLLLGAVLAVLKWATLLLCVLSSRMLFTADIHSDETKCLLNESSETTLQNKSIYISCFSAIFKKKLHELVKCLRVKKRIKEQEENKNHKHLPELQRILGQGKLRTPKTLCLPYCAYRIDIFQTHSPQYKRRL